MIFTRSICSSQTFNQGFFVKRLRLLFLLTLVGITTGCQKDVGPVGVDSALFPVQSENDIQAFTGPFNNEPILLRLDSKQRLNDEVVSTVLEKIVGDPILLCDKPLYFEEDSIPAGINLFDTFLPRLTTITANGSNGTYPSHYIIHINQSEDTTFYQKNKGIYGFRINTQTENGFSIDETAFVNLQ